MLTDLALRSQGLLRCAMPEKRLDALLAEIAGATVRGRSDTLIRGLAIDSRQVSAGFLFAAFPGIHVDGHRFIPQAFERGAAAALHSADVADPGAGRALVRVPDTRLAMSAAAAAFYDHPDRALKVFGVTGTDGKSTTVWFIQQMLEMTGAKSGFFSSVDLQTSGPRIPNPIHSSTPEAHEVHKLLAEMRDAGCAYAIVEATSHGLSPRTGRLADVCYDVAVFTNVTEEHREFHGSLEQYRLDKARLFGALKSTGSSFGVANRDDPHWRLFAEAAGSRPTRTYSLRDPAADLRAAVLEESLRGSRSVLHAGPAEIEARLALPGRHNVENLMAALLAVSGLTGAPVADLVALAPRLTAPAGRLRRIETDRPFEVFVDFAHTPGAFQKVLGFIRSRTRGRLIVVFGSAGERDVEKRPAQGRVASELADVVILADEDPRGEEPMEILRQIAGGATGGAEVRLIPDRRSALRAALTEARAGDVVMCLGKAHEKTIEYASGPVPWDEVGAVREILAGRG
jgi:UDP-N-acetylmuramoyl-L-alanyl-D-glutamate--2,6-diaminopimelate ligase